MISKNGLLATIIEAVYTLTGERVYQNSSREIKVVDAKWLFLKIVDFVFLHPNANLKHLKKPTLNELAYQLGYIDTSGVTKLRKYSPADKDSKRKLEILKELLIEYTNIKISKQQLKELLIQNKFTLTDVIDCVIELNGLIGVGLITLSEGIDEYIRNKNKII